jgi:hypothetical protein
VALLAAGVAITAMVRLRVVSGDTVRMEADRNAAAQLAKVEADRNAVAQLAKEYALKSLNYSFQDPDAFFRSRNFSRRMSPVGV